MKRDMDLVRKLLIEIEGIEGKNLDWQKIKVDGYSFDQIEHHLVLMKDAGLLLGPPLVTYIEKGFGSQAREAPIADPKFFCLSWAGHEFLDEARDDTKWTKAKEVAKDKGGGLAFELIKMALGELAKIGVRQALGIHGPPLP